MINYLHYLTHRPERGWDPISLEGALAYDALEAGHGVTRQALVSRLEDRLGRLEGKTVLDLGGGPGHYTAEFAARGASVTWFDVSATYAEIAKSNCQARGVSPRFVIGYIDDVARAGQTFDLIFARLCWYYAYDEPRLAREVVKALKPNGLAYIETPTLDWNRGDSRLGRLRSRLNAVMGLKIGHPFSPPGRAASLFRRQKGVSVEEGLARPGHDQVFIRKLS